jgi:hypothetical protein
VVYVEDLRGALNAREGDRDVASYKGAFAELAALAPPASYLEEAIGGILAQMPTTGDEQATWEQR